MTDQPYAARYGRLLAAILLIVALAVAAISYAASSALPVASGQTQVGCSATSPCSYLVLGIGPHPSGVRPITYSRFTVASGPEWAKSNTMLVVCPCPKGTEWVAIQTPPATGISGTGGTPAPG